ncbi:MAG TPA: putative glycolipid-binding domain-containing protein [Streptosporangiaceae bacterium]
MSFTPMPTTAAWRHQGARSGFEVVYFRDHPDGCAIEGWTAAVEDGVTWAVQYAIEVDTAWLTQSARLLARSASGYRSTRLTADGAGHWLVDGEPAPHLDGCLDVDLESSAMTNALPVRRLGLPVAALAAAPAAYVRVTGLAVERLEQTYLRRAGDPTRQRYDYAAPAFNFSCVLVYDEAGLVLDYPGIATRAA